MSFITKRSVNGTTHSWDNNGNNLGFDEKPEKKNSISNYNFNIGIRERLQINEWTFSLFLFCFSLSIVIGKLFVNYGEEVLKWQTELNNYKFTSLPSVAFPNIMTNLSSISIENLKPRLNLNYSDRLIKVGKNFLNDSQKYEEAFSYAVMKFIVQYWIWMRAALSGISMMGFTWYIIYKDSSVPGVNPPSPLSSLSRKRGQSQYSMQINYFVGVLNGILIFIYLSL